MLFRIDPAASEPLFAQLASQVRLAAARGDLRSGERLPAARDLAESLDLNVHTVLRAYQDLRDEGDLTLEGVEGVPVRGSHGDEHQGVEGEPQGCGIEVGAVAEDRPGPLQRTQPPVAGRHAQPHPRGELGDRETAVLLHLRKNLSVNVVHAHNLCSRGPLRARTWKHFWADPAYCRPRLENASRLVVTGGAGMAAASITGFWAVSVLLSLTPGADWAYAISAGLRHRTVVPAVAGMVGGHALHVARFPMALTVLTLVGAAYLVWLGVLTLLRPGLPQAGEELPTESWARRLLTGTGVSGLNPKVFLLILVLLPQFTDSTSHWPLGIQILTLGAVHLATCTVVYLAVGTGARRVLRTRPTAAKLVTRASGVAMTVIGVTLVVQRLTGQI